MSDTLKILLSIGIVILCVFLFIGTFLLNKRTPKPDGCEDVSQECESCSMVGCSHHPSSNIVNKKEDEEEEKKND